MKKTLFSLLIALSSAFSAQAQKFDWVRKIGDLGNDCPGQIANDSIGSVYVAGTFTGTIGFESGDTLHSTDISDASMFLAKFDSNGHALFARLLPMSNPFIGDCSWISITKVRVNPVNGMIAILGNLNYNGPNYAYLAMLRPDGSLVGYSDASGDSWNSDMAFDSLGNEYLCGFTMSSVQSSYLAKYDTAGITQWSYASTEANKAYSITVHDGNVYAAGEFKGQMHAPDTTGAAPVTLNAATFTSWALFELKYDLAGHLADGHAGSSTLPTMGPITPTLAGDFAPTGAWNVSYVNPSTDVMYVYSYGLNFSSSLLVASNVATCPSPVLSGNVFDGSGMFSSSSMYGCDPGSAYAFEHGVLDHTTDSIPSATGHPSGTLPSAPIVAFSMDKNGSRYVTGEFAGALRYRSETGAATISSTGGTYDIYVGKYHRCASYSPTVMLSHDSLTSSIIASGLTYQWFRNDTAITGATRDWYIPPTDGSYQVVIEDGWGCSSTSPADTVTTPTEATLLSATDEVRMYPNPTSATTTLAGLPEGMPIQIEDMTGKTLISTFSEFRQTIIDIRQLPRGMYMLKTPLGTKKLTKL